MRKIIASMFISLYRETRNIGPEGRQRIAPGAKVCTVIEAYPLASLKGRAESAQQPKPWVMREFRISPERAKQTICVALSGLYQNYFSTQGSVARYARSSTLGCAAARFQRAFSSVKKHNS
jgi:hypothetical protein